MDRDIEKIVQQLLEVTIDMDQQTLQALDEAGLLQVAVALSKWRDNIG